MAKKDVILFVIKEVMQKNKEIHSLHSLKELVNTRLKMVDSKLSVSERRLKNIILEIPEAKIIVETRKGKKPMKCPVCFSSLKNVYTKNLEGKKILYRMVCKRCGYSGVNGKFEPKRYRFVKL